MSLLYQLDEGTVKSFDPQKGKQYGFLATEIADVFFHWNDAREIVLDGTGTPKFSDKHEEMMPKKGDQIVFTRDMNRSGVIAKPWTFYHLYIKAMRECGKRFLPSDQVIERYPYLAEIVVRAKRPMDQGKFSVEELKLDSTVLGMCGERDPSHDSCILLFAVINDPKVIWRIHRFEIKSPAGWKEDGSHNDGRLVSAPSISTQLEKMEPQWHKPLAIVSVNTNQYLNHTGAQYLHHRIIRVYR